MAAVLARHLAVARRAPVRGGTWRRARAQVAHHLACAPAAPSAGLRRGAVRQGLGSGRLASRGWGRHAATQGSIAAAGHNLARLGACGALARRLGCRLLRIEPRRRFRVALGRHVQLEPHRAAVELFGEQGLAQHGTSAAAVCEIEEERERVGHGRRVRGQRQRLPGRARVLLDLRRGGDLISMQLEAKLLTAPEQQLRGVRVRLTNLAHRAMELDGLHPSGEAEWHRRRARRRARAPQPAEMASPAGL